MIAVGDVVTMPVREYSAWERLLRCITLGRYRMRGRLIRRAFTVTSETASHAVSVVRPDFPVKVHRETCPTSCWCI